MSAVDRGGSELGTIAAVLPLERRDELAELLTDQGVATLRHVINESMSENTLRELTSDRSSAVMTEDTRYSVLAVTR